MRGVHIQIRNWSMAAFTPPRVGSTSSLAAAVLAAVSRLLLLQNARQTADALRQYSFWRF